MTQTKRAKMIFLKVAIYTCLFAGLSWCTASAEGETQQKTGWFGRLRERWRKGQEAIPPEPAPTKAPERKIAPRKAAPETVPAILPSEKYVPPRPPVGREELSKEDILGRLNEIFKYRLDIRAAITGIEEKTDAKGNVFYEYNGIQLEKLDKDILSGILKAVNNQISLKNLQNLQRTQAQLKNLERLQQFERTQKTLKALKSPPGAPKTYTPPKIPKVPKPYKPPRRY